MGLGPRQKEPRDSGKVMDICWTPTMCWETPQTTSALIVTTTFPGGNYNSSFERWRRPRERGSVVPKVTELASSRRTRMDSQTLRPPNLNPHCLWSRKGWERIENGVNLVHPWLQNYYLSFSLMRPITPFKTIKDLTPKVPQCNRTLPIENPGGSSLRWNLEGVDAKVIRRYEMRVIGNTESSLYEKERTKELYPQGWMKKRSLYQVPQRRRKRIKSTLPPPLPQFTSLQKLQFKLKKERRVWPLWCLCSL